MPSYKVVRSGHIVEIYEYQRSISRRFDDEKGRLGGRDKEGKEERKMEYRTSVNHKAFQKIRRLINANFDENSLFVTLTYAENMQDIKASYQNLKKFFQKLKRKQSDFSYVAVLEFQKRGAIHYHMLCNYVANWNTLEELQTHERELAKMWGHGFVDIGYKKNDNAGAYLLKYMTKEHYDCRLDGNKRYFFSRNLKQPEELEMGEALEIIEEFRELPPVFTSNYDSEWDGKVQYREYNEKRIDYQAVKNALEQQKDDNVKKAVDLFGRENVTILE